MKETKRYFGHDQEPEFDENYHAINMPSHSMTTVEGTTVTYVIHLDDDGQVVIGEYHNGVNVRNTNFRTYDAYREWYECEHQLHRSFQEWMKEREKNKAKVIKMER